MRYQTSYSIRPKKTGDDKENDSKKENRWTDIPSFDPDEIKKLLGSHTPHKSRKIIKTLIVIGGGVAVGLVFGYVLLHTFVNPSPEGKPAGGVAQQANGSPTNNFGKETNVQLPAFTFYFVQGGVFSSQESANKTASEFKNKQFPAEVVQEDGKFVVYAGVAASRDDALAIAQLYRSQKQDVLIKEKQIAPRTITLKIPQSVHSDTIGLAGKLGSTSTEMIQVLTTLASEGLKSGKSGSLTDSKLTSIHQTYLQEGAAFAGLLQGAGRDNLQKSLNEMTGAVNAARQYLKSPDRAYLMQLQGCLIRYYNIENLLQSGSFS